MADEPCAECTALKKQLTVARNVSRSLAAENQLLLAKNATLLFEADQRARRVRRTGEV